ncbi:3'-5' exonuclease [Azospirillum ramasamyi]|nr:3'-5' exonuclease [Azospirillum ramasamyi]
MKILTGQPATSEQLRIISEGRPGTDVIRGAAGSGKTHTAILRLETLTDIFKNRLDRSGSGRPVKVLVLTFNRTLCGYVEAFARQSALSAGPVSMEVETFARWAMIHTGMPQVVSQGQRNDIIRSLASDIGLPHDFICSELEYIAGRFKNNDLETYLGVRRDGRGAVPRVDRPVREKLIAVLKEYKKQLALSSVCDWEDLSAAMLSVDGLNYDIIIVDEAQDFSANQIRAITHHLAPVNFFTLILDTAQRLYPRGYNWNEVGLGSNVRYHKLRENHRNTTEIAAFAAGILNGIQIDDDGALPDLSAAKRTGTKPTVVTGLYSKQVDYAINFIKNNVDLSKESVAFLQPRDGQFFDFLKGRLAQAGISYEAITRKREWPDESVNVVLSTMHSAKGLEFEHVFILGLSALVTPHGEDQEDDQLLTLRRLLAMAVARARISVHVGYKPGEESDLIQFFVPGTFQQMVV